MEYKQDQAYINLIQDISNYNKKFEQSLPLKDKTRGFWGDLWNSIKGYVFADAQGALNNIAQNNGKVSVNTLISAAVESVKYAIDQNDEVSSIDNTNPEFISISVDNTKPSLGLTENKTDIISEIGVLHNELIYEYSKNKKELSDILKSELEKDLSNIVDGMIKDNKISQSLINGTSIYDYLSDDISEIADENKPIYGGASYGSYNYNNGSSGGSGRHHEKESDYYYKLKKDYAQDVSRISDNERVSAYAKGVTDIVSNSKISNDDKLKLKIFISIASNSKVLWDKK